MEKCFFCIAFSKKRHIGITYIFHTKVFCPKFYIFQSTLIFPFQLSIPPLKQSRKSVWTGPMPTVADQQSPGTLMRRTEPMPTAAAHQPPGIPMRKGQGTCRRRQPNRSPWQTSARPKWTFQTVHSFLFFPSKHEKKCITQ